MSLENFWVPETELKKRASEELDNFLDGKDDDKDRYDISGEISNNERGRDSHEKVPSGLIATNNFFERTGVEIQEVYEWYAAAISRRDREPLNKSNFVAHFEGMSSDPTYAFGDREKGFLLGYLKYGVFVPTHFSPKTMRGGYTLIKNLGDSSDIPSILAITEDLEETLSKMPSWKTLNVDFLSRFRNELHNKKIMYNSHPDVKNLMLGLVSEYLEEMKK